MRTRLTLAYDGTDFAGFQYQPGQRTVQGVLQAALTKLSAQPIAIHGSGRTDAGVHARGQVCHFDSPLPIEGERYRLILEHRLPQDMSVRHSSTVDGRFHARFDAQWKWYRYVVCQQRFPSPDRVRFATHLPRRVALERMQEAALSLQGTHDFSAFCGPCPVLDRVRTIYGCRVRAHRTGWMLDVVGNGFLYRMVRILAGTLYAVGQREKQPAEIASILAGCDRRQAGPTLPATGLFLMRVGYSPWQRKEER